MILKLRYRKLGGHVHVRVFVGETTESLALSGTLVFGVGEWLIFEEALARGADQSDSVQAYAMMEDDAS